MKPSLIIIGLGNPGKQYEETRHNAGFKAVDLLAKEFGTGEWEERQKFLSHVLEARIVTAPVLLVKPQTFMNRSGEAAKKLLDFYKVEPKVVFVLSDDIDLPLGDLRFRESGGPGTHNGLKSVVDHIGENFPRLRIGIGGQKPGEDLSTYVLSKPPASEKAMIEDTIEKIPGMVREFVMGTTSP
jgi:PTH1 family peptidyl-tRNA hydrolase